MCVVWLCAVADMRETGEASIVMGRDRAWQCGLCVLSIDGYLADHLPQLFRIFRDDVLH